MYRDLVTSLGGGVPNVGDANRVLTQFTPLQLASYVETVWSAPRLPLRAWNLPALQNLAPAVPPPAPNSNAYSQAMSRAIAQLPLPAPPVAAMPLINWGHLIAAYLVENTGVVEIMRRVITEWVTDERLPFASLESQYWMRATEELFFTSPSPYFTSLASALRPDNAWIRENAYQRVLGLDLAFRRDGVVGPPRPRITNDSFSSKFERLLFEVWRGIINATNVASENRTDQQAVAELVRDIREMLNSRRADGTLLREEAAAVATLSWFHLTVEYNTLIVENLNAHAENAAERLGKIGALVGMRPSRAADSYFNLADAMSLLMVLVETGLLEFVGVQFMYNGVLPALSNMMQLIILHWERATGRSIKEASAVRSLQVPVTASITPPAGTLNRLAGVAVTI